MTTEHTLDAVTEGRAQPIAVGRYVDRHGQSRLMPFSHQEQERATLAFAKRVGAFHLRTGAQVLVTSMLEESAHVAPFERSLQDFGLVLLSADASFFDAARSESILRRFDVAAMVGLNGAVLDGWAALGHDPAHLLAGRLVWARPDAHARLHDVPGIRLHLWLPVGPAIAMECTHGRGAHIDRLEWNVDEHEGEIVLSSRLDRAVDFQGYRTGVKARLEHASCACGSADPRIVLN